MTWQEADQPWLAVVSQVARKVGKKVLVFWTGSCLAAWVNSLSWLMLVVWVVGLSPETPYPEGKSWLGLRLLSWLWPRDVQWESMQPPACGLQRGLSVGGTKRAKEFC